MKYSYNSVVLTLIKDQKQTIGKLASHLSLSQQGLRNKLQSNRFSPEQIDLMASFLGMSTKELLELCLRDKEPLRQEEEFKTKYIAELEDRVKCQEAENKHLREANAVLLANAEIVTKWASWHPFLGELAPAPVPKRMAG